MTDATPAATDNQKAFFGMRLNIGFWAGIAVALCLQLFPPPDGLSADGWRIASLGLLMAIWWASEAVPLAVTGLLPLALAPLITNLSIGSVVAPPYASTIVLLLMGGLMMAKGVERWGLHERIALNVVSRVGDHPRALVFGFMTATALLSMWISNSATTLMMVPIALSAAVAGGDKDGGPLTKALLLGVAYSASIGGVATPVGTPTNLIALSFLQEAGAGSISFLQWMMFGVPTVLLMIPLAWLIICFGGVGRITHSSAGEGGEKVQAAIKERLKALGAMSRQETRVAIVFAIVAGLWIFRQLLQQVPGLSGLTDTGIAFIGAVAMMIVPAGNGTRKPLVEWKDAETIPWSVILLFGGGMSLAKCVEISGLAGWMGAQLSIAEVLPTWLLVMLVVTIMIYLTELTSNVATTSTFMPVLAILAVATDIPFAALAGPAAVAASCAFMLPVATAPNAIIYASGKVQVKDMLRAGMRLNLTGVAVLTLVGLVLAPIALG